jgi:quercetin dioxygenase-like cupin family protein
MTTPFILGPGEHRSPVSQQRPWSFRLTGDDSEGRISVGQGTLPPLTAGPPLHVHTNEDELFLVVEGVLTVQLGDTLHEVEAGGLVWGARGTPHAFANRSTASTRLMSFIVPAGVESMFAEQDAYLDSLQGPPDWQRLAHISERFGVTQLGSQIEIPGRED